MNLDIEVAGICNKLTYRGPAGHQDKIEISLHIGLAGLGYENEIVNGIGPARVLLEDKNPTDIGAAGLSEKPESPLGRGAARL